MPCAPSAVPSRLVDGVNLINASIPADSPFRCWIDQPSTHRLSTARIVIRGWCYHRSGESVRAIRARLGGRVFPGHYGDPRPDVAQAFGGEAGSARPAYEIAVTLPGGRATCVVEAQLADTAWHHVQTLTVETDRAVAFRERVRWLLFWLQAWRGRRDAWDALPRADQEFLVATARHRGWFNLELAPQHPPRPVTLETFPAGRLAPDRLPRLAVVTPSFQQAAFLEQTMQSVLGQTGVPLEYIVQDGGSNDGSREILQRHAGRLAYWESAPDKGQADAIVRGFQHATGGPDDLMMYLNSDDLLMPGAARYVAEYFARHPEVDAVYGHRVIIDDDGKEVGRWLSPRTACDDLRFQDLVPQETLFWRRRIWDRVGGIDRSFRFAMDWDLLLRFQAAGARIVRLPWFLGLFRVHPQQKSQAWMEKVGIPEMDALRARALGREPTDEELQTSMRRAQFDSALVYALWRRGWRV